MREGSDFRHEDKRSTAAAGKEGALDKTAEKRSRNSPSESPDATFGSLFEVTSNNTEEKRLHFLRKEEPTSQSPASRRSAPPMLFLLSLKISSERAALSCPSLRFHTEKLVLSLSPTFLNRKHAAEAPQAFRVYIEHAAEDGLKWVQAGALSPRPLIKISVADSFLLLPLCRDGEGLGEGKYGVSAARSAESPQSVRRSRPLFRLRRQRDFALFFSLRHRRRGRLECGAGGCSAERLGEVRSLH